MEITMMVTHNVGLKLQLVKLIKDVSVLGLKDAKDFCDNMTKNKNHSFKLTLLSSDSYKQLIDSLKKFDMDYVVLSGGIEYKRNLNLLKLGIGTDEDYFNLFKEEFLLYKNEALIEALIEATGKDTLAKILNKVDDRI